MKNILLLIFVSIIISCVSKEVTLPANPPSQNVPSSSSETVLIRSFPSDRPNWTYQEPQSKDGYLFFVGISENHSLERDARNSARRDSVRTFAAYCGVEVFDLHRAVSTSFSLSSGITDPTVVTKQQQEQMVDAYVSRVKAREWYIEEWALISDNAIIERYYRVYVKSAVPSDEYYKVMEYKRK